MDVKDAPPVQPAAADLLVSFGGMEEKAMALARVVPEEKYDWRPAAGTDALMKQIEENTVAERRPVTRQKLLEMLAESFQGVREAIETSRAPALARAVDFFGTPTTRRGVLVAIDGHIGEHVGQLIAYARMNGIVPPWSQPAK